MNRYVFLSFLFMGWGFYEVSGGADFEPKSAKQVLGSETFVENGVQAEGDATELKTFEVVAEAAPSILVGDPSNLDAVNDSIAPIVSENGTSYEALGTIGFEATIDPSIDKTTPPAENENVFSLATLGEALEAETPVKVWDYRSVKGVAANLRSGPGKGFSVVSRLNGGARVRVLDDPGEGWLEIHHFKFDTTGWIAASKLTPLPAIPKLAD